MSNLDLIKPRKRKVSTTFYADPEVKEKMQKAAKEDGLSYAEAIHNGCILYLKSRQEDYLDEDSVNYEQDLFEEDE